MAETWFNSIVVDTSKLITPNLDRTSTRLNSSHVGETRMPTSG